MKNTNKTYVQSQLHISWTNLFVCFPFRELFRFSWNADLGLVINNLDHQQKVPLQPLIIFPIRSTIFGGSKKKDQKEIVGDNFARWIFVLKLSQSTSIFHHDKTVPFFHERMSTEQKNISNELKSLDKDNLIKSAFFRLTRNLFWH